MKNLLGKELFNIERGFTMTQDKQADKIKNSTGSELSKYLNKFNNESHCLDEIKL